MLRITQQKNAGGVQSYFRENLRQGDYYTKGDVIPGTWGGAGAQTLGLSGAVEKEHFYRLSENKHPLTDEKLTVRVKQNRIVGHDFTFNSPKSVSVQYGLTRDPELLAAFHTAVGKTMTELETYAQTRVRVNNAQTVRTTGNLTWASFTHTTARPVGGIPDPHLHSHCYVFNATYDSVENRWKAVNYYDIYKNAPYYEAVFHSHLAKELRQQGYTIQRTENRWELAHVPPSVIEKFSRRTAVIEQTAAERGITNDKLKAYLGGVTREAKTAAYNEELLTRYWGEQLTPEEAKAMNDGKAFKTPERVTELQPRMVIASAAQAYNERGYPVDDRRIMADAMVNLVERYSPEDVRHEYGLMKQDYVSMNLSINRTTAVAGVEKVEVPAEAEGAPKKEKEKEDELDDTGIDIADEMELTDDYDSDVDV